MCKHAFGVARTIWPYKEGYGVFCKKCKMILDTGLPKKQAFEIAKQENSKIPTLIKTLFKLLGGKSG